MIVDVFIRTGQSNSWGQNPGGSGSRTLAAVRYWDSGLATYPDSSAWHDLNDTHGADYELGAALDAAGLNVAILNVSQGATSSLNWTSGQTVFTAASAEIAQALALLAAEYAAGTLFRYHHIRNQGESEATNSTLAVVQQWAENTTAWHAALEGIVGSVMSIGVCLTNANISGRTHPGVLEAEQAAVADWSLDQTGYGYEVDQVHMTTAGYVAYGQALAAAFLAFFERGGISTDLKNKLVNHARNTAAYTSPATVYYGARIAGVEVTGNGYARKGVTNNTTNYPDASGDVKTLAVEQQFTPASGGDWGLIDEIVEYDASSGGNVRASSKLANPIQINDGDTLVIPAGGFQITMPPGRFEQSVRHSLLNLAWGGTPYSAPATTYGSYFDGDPQGSGTPLGSRVAITQATTWGAASGGEADNSAAVSITQQAAATHWAEHTASSGGSLLYSGELSEAPNTGALDVNALHTTIEDAA